MHVVSNPVDILTYLAAVRGRAAYNGDRVGNPAGHDPFPQPSSRIASSAADAG